MLTDGSDNAIFLAFDDAYSLYARACLNSMMANYPNYPQLHVYYDGKQESMLSYLRGIARLTLIEQNALTPIEQCFSLGEVGSRGVYYKYHCWSDSFAQFDNVMYLDVDTVVLQPFDELFARGSFFAVPNHDPWPGVRIFNETVGANETLMKQLESDDIIDVFGVDDMCNAGVFVLPSNLRNARQYSRLLEITRRYNAHLKYADQSAISLWCKQNKIEYSQAYRYNFQAAFFGYSAFCKTELTDINILHFSSKRKPNTVEFMLWERIPLARRKMLAQLFLTYAQEQRA